MDSSISVDDNVENDDESTLEPLLCNVPSSSCSAEEGDKIEDEFVDFDACGISSKSLTESDGFIGVEESRKLLNGRCPNARVQSDNQINSLLASEIVDPKIDTDLPDHGPETPLLEKNYDNKSVTASNTSPVISSVNETCIMSPSFEDFENEGTKSKWRQATMSDYSSLSSGSSRKSDILNGNIVSIQVDYKCNPYLTDTSEDQNSLESSATLLQRENSDLTANSQPQPTTPTGSCLKAGNKATTGVHVQFETPLNLKDGVTIQETYLVENGKTCSINKNDTSKFWSKVQSSDSCESTPFSSLKKNRKKRSRQPSGSSLTSLGSSSTNTSDSRTTEFERRAPDGGWGWVVVFASFMVHCIADGVTMSFGVLYVEFLAYFEESKSLTSWIGSLFMAIPLLAGPLASLLTDRYGCRTVTIWGAIISCLGFFISSFANSILVLFLTLGMITGIGLAVCYVAAIVIVAFYFEKYRSLATGIAVAGSGIGTFIFAPIIQHLLDSFGWRGCLMILSGIFLNMAVCGTLMRDLEWTKRRSDKGFSSTNTSSGSRQCSVTQSSDTLGMRGGVTESNTLPSLDELKRLVQSGEITSVLSGEENRCDITRSESLVLLPTFLNHTVFPKDFIPYLSSKANAYEVVSQIYPHLLSRSLSQKLSQSDLVSKEMKKKCLQVQISFQNDDNIQDTLLKSIERQDNQKEEQADSEKNGLIGVNSEKEKKLSEWAKLDINEARILSPKRATTKSASRQVVSRRISCIGSLSSPTVPAAPLKDMKVSRQSMTFRGAMLNINRYRLRASSCPNIFRNSIITIAETENQNAWSYLDDLGEMLTACVDLNYCLDFSYLIFALSNFILYVFYDTVYMYLTDYAIGIGISADTGANLISAIGILNCVGMVLMGYIGDQSWSSPMLIYNVSMVACGLSVIAMPFITNFWLLAAAAAVFGLFISANYALTAVILVELISLEAFSKSYGLLLLIQGIANLIGPPLVGLMADATGEYVLPFVISGIFIVICGLMLSFIPLVQKCKEHYRSDTSPNSSPRRSPQRSQKSLPGNKKLEYPVTV